MPLTGRQHHALASHLAGHLLTAPPCESDSALGRESGSAAVVEGSPASGGRVSRPTIATHRGLGSEQTWDLSIVLHKQDPPFPKFYLRNT